MSASLLLFLFTLSAFLSSILSSFHKKIVGKRQVGTIDSNKIGEGVVKREKKRETPLKTS